ncbi:MAG: TonB-dependent receptor plug domain-containing protein, partial [Bacteroidales bacterium]|nr:TonB-dependent receptor plug domain-containing protein [Bacteroidales bacterium]
MNNSKIYFLNTILGIHKRLLCFVTLMMVLCMTSLAQKKAESKVAQVNAIIQNNEGDAIVNAMVYGNEGEVYAVSDVSGEFHINVSKASTIRIEAAGYIPVNLPVILIENGQTINMEPTGDLSADEITIPFGSLKRNQMVGSVGTIRPDDIIPSDSRTGVLTTINGRVPGVMNGSFIHGLGSALIVVDGLPRTNVSDYNLQEIEEITVLKDASSRMLYGALANNGVILIKTKRGEAYKKDIRVSGEYSVATPKRLPNYVSSADYAELYNEALENDKFGSNSPQQFEDRKFTTEQLAGFRNGSSLRYPDEDYYSSEYVNPIQHSSKVIAEFSGGNKMA